MLYVLEVKFDKNVAFNIFKFTEHPTSKIIKRHFEQQEQEQQKKILFNKKVNEWLINYYNNISLIYNDRTNNEEYDRYIEYSDFNDII